MNLWPSKTMVKSTSHWITTNHILITFHFIYQSLQPMYMTIKENMQLFKICLAKTCKTYFVLKVIRHCPICFLRTSDVPNQAPKLFPQLLVLQGQWLENPLSLQQNLLALHFCIIMSSPDWQNSVKCCFACILYCCFDTRTIIIIIIMRILYNTTCL